MINGILLFFISFMCFAFEVPEFIPNVVDKTATLSESQLREINAEIDRAQKKGVLTGILLVNTLGGDTIEDIAEKVFRKWKLGEKGKDNGVLILIAIKDRKMRIEVGYGLEGIIPDVVASNIINSIMKPNFRNGDFAKGILDSIEAMSLLAEGEYPSYGSENFEGEAEKYDWPVFKERFIWWVALFVLLPALIGTFGTLLARFKGAKGLALQEKKKKSNRWWMLGVSGGTGLGVKTFLFVNPGIFITLLPAVFTEIFVTIIMNVFFVVAVYFSNSIVVNHIRDLFSEDRMRRIQASERLKKFRSTKFAGSSYSMFGKRYTVPKRSSSSGSSRSSSSSGGRSGGGGASGRW